MYARLSRIHIAVLLVQVRQNVQRTLAIELQKMSLAFRKQQKQFLKKVSQKNGTQLSSSSLSVLDNDGPSARSGEDEYDPGFSDLQVCPYGLPACLQKYPS